MIARDNRMLGSGSASATVAAMVERARGTRRLETRSLTLGVGGTTGINSVLYDVGGNQMEEDIDQSKLYFEGGVSSACTKARY